MAFENPWEVSLFGVSLKIACFAMPCSHCPKTSFVVEKVSSVLYKQKFLTYVLADFFLNNLTKKNGVSNRP